MSRPRGSLISDGEGVLILKDLKGPKNTKEAWLMLHATWLLVHTLWLMLHGLWLLLHASWTGFLAYAARPGTLSGFWCTAQVSGRPE